MCDGTSQQTVKEAKKLANEYVRLTLERAMRYEKISQSYPRDAANARRARFMHEAAMRNLGLAIHTLQDSTSPSHRGFQSWDENGCPIRHIWHGLKENSYPDDDAELRRVTRYAYEIFSNKKPMPQTFFK